MTFINRDGLKYETKTIITQAYQPAKPAIEAVEEVPPQPAVEPVDAVQPTYDADGNELTPYIPAQPGHAAVPGIPGSPYVPAQPEVPEVTAVVETGKIIGIEADIWPSPSIARPHKRTLEFLSAMDENDLEMILSMRVIYYTEDGSMRMQEAIRRDDTLSNDAKAMLLQQYADYVFEPKSTRDSLVDPATGALVKSDFPGAISEMQHLQSLTRTELIAYGIPPTERRQQILRYLTIKLQMLTIAQREGI